MTTNFTDDFNIGITNLGSLTTQNVLTASNGTIGVTNWDPNTNWKLINNNGQYGGKLTYDGGTNCLDITSKPPYISSGSCNKATNWGIATSSNNVLVTNQLNELNEPVGLYSWALDIGSNPNNFLTNVTQTSPVCLNGNTARCNTLPQSLIENSLIGTNTKIGVCTGSIPTTSGGVFAPGGGGCPNFMTNYCANTWLNNSTDPVAAQNCNTYLSSGIDTKQTVSDTIINYINSRPIVQGCPQTSSCDSNNSNFTNSDYCKARDSNDPFFTKTLQTLCSFQPDACQPILSQYCYKWCRQDLENDPTLQSICGCYMSNCQSSGSCSTPFPQANLNINNPTTINNQYFNTSTQNTAPLSFACDPICRFGSTIQNKIFPTCDDTVCVIDVNNMNLNNGSTINIQNLCGGGATNPSSCYISTQAIDVANNSKINITNNCTSCFTYDETNPSGATEVKCGTLPGIGNGGNGSSTIINKIIEFIQKNKIGILGILGGIFLLIFILALIF